jgi:hypothetical protein
MRDKRPRGSGAADKGDEVAPPHGLPRQAEDHCYHTRRVRAMLCITAKIGGERPRCRRAAEKRDELAPFPSMEMD